MKNFFCFLTGTVFLISCSTNIPTESTTENRSPKIEIQKTETGLKTGWYYIGTAETGIERTLKGTSETLFVIPAPIVTVSHFKELSISLDAYGNMMLLIGLNKAGTEKWSVATLKAIDKRLAFIIDDLLFYAPYVNSQITGGQTALNGDFSKEELTAIKNKLEAEKSSAELD